ncbi:MAG TPA: helix-turn-helix transcriptional regulator [Streptosporangiaceae bacterium]|nr:helix-turn-helix transcriptional regulator [Streptosporangiaceae bacterium]
MSEQIVLADARRIRDSVLSEPAISDPVISDPAVLAMASAPVAPGRRAEGRRRELAGFLRSRRERIAPEEVGLPPASRRRTPGLRREEVATLAGVGVTWYTWLEQGRDINASPQVLDAVARTLLLDPHERDHLFRLADTTDNSGQSECKTLSPTAQLLLDQLEPFPACIRNARYDVLAYNDAYDDLIGPLGHLPFEERNSLWRMFTNEACRAAMLDWEEGTRRMVAEYRAAMAEHVAEPAWKCLVSRLTSASPEFAELWERHEVASPENLTKRYMHPEVGLLKLNYTHLWLGQRLGTRMTTYTPADEKTDAKLRDLQDRRRQLTARGRPPQLTSRRP